MDHRLAAVSFTNEVGQHLLGHGEVGDDAVLHRPDRDDIPRGPAQHVFCFLPNGFHLVRYLIDSNDGRLVYDNATSLGIDECIGGPQIDGEVARKEAEETAKIHELRSSLHLLQKRVDHTEKADKVQHIHLMLRYGVISWVEEDRFHVGFHAETTPKTEMGVGSGYFHSRRGDDRAVSPVRD